MVNLEYSKFNVSNLSIDKIFNSIGLPVSKGVDTNPRSNEGHYHFNLKLTWKRSGNLGSLLRIVGCHSILWIILKPSTRADSVVMQQSPTVSCTKPSQFGVCFTRPCFIIRVSHIIEWSLTRDTCRVDILPWLEWQVCWFTVKGYG